MSMHSTRFAGGTIDGCHLGEWLEDTDRFARYEVLSEDGIPAQEQSAWVCTDCEQFVENCECGDDLVEYLDL